MSEPDVVAHGRPCWTTLISGSITNGTLELIEEVRVTRGGPYPHVHRGRDEAFHVTYDVHPADRSGDGGSD